MTELERCAAAGRRWRIGAYEFERAPRHREPSQATVAAGSEVAGEIAVMPPPRGRWGCCYRNMRGAGNCRTPLGAFFALRRWMRQPVTPA